MSKAKKSFEVVRVTKYFFRKGGVLETKPYDWIGNETICGLYPVELNGKLGFANRNGEIVIPIIYDTERRHGVMNLLDGDSNYIKLRKNKLCGLVRHDGSVAVDFKWNEIKFKELNEDFVPVKKNGKWGFANLEDNKLQIEPEYDLVEFFKDGLAPINIEDKWGLIDVNGNVICEPKYIRIERFKWNFAIAYEGGTLTTDIGGVDTWGSNWKIINKKGYEIISFSACDSIIRAGFNTFVLKVHTKRKEITLTKQLIPFSDYIVIIDNGEYVEGYVSADGKCIKEFDKNKLVKHLKMMYKAGKYFGRDGRCLGKLGEVSDYIEYEGHEFVLYPKAKYIGGGTWSAVDYTGKEIEIPNSVMKEIKNSLLENS